ncbi:P-loop containing nucleoside triphosphate hydrolase protein [Blastocladiella britannica]|nr:P-loop containing nucleoside triphosphate hydrolase protein [Blastocladiella britannica]
MIAAQRAAEEEAARVEAEERRREEEERKRVEEEERVREEARLLKKEQQKAKKEQLRKEGKLLTKTQQEAKRRNELKLQQLLAAGVVVPALTQGAGQDDDADQGDRPKKRVVYENKKKRRPAAVAGAAAASEPGADAAVGDFKLQKQRAKEEATAAAAAAAEAAKVAAAAAKAEAEEDEDDTKDAWDASSSEDEESAADEEVKDDWDASSESESESKAPTKAPAAAAAANGKKNATPAPTKSKPAAKAVKAESSDEDSEEDSDDDDSESGSDWDDSDSEEDEETAQERKRRIAEEERIKEAAARRAARHEAALAARSKDDLRSPVCCILGHVDTGKTKLLDKIRQTNVQEGEAGGITQQIGATYFPQDAILKKTEVLNKTDLEIKLPGLLIIDTPGHESFTNLRSRGSSLCNIAVLVVDIMHGLEPQTIESLNLLRNRKTPFIVALNKIDRIYGWAETPNGGFEASFAKQAKSVQKEYKDRLDRIKLAFSEQGLNSEVYYDNKNMSKYVSIVPTSAITGEGIPDLLYLLVHLTQSRMSEKLMYVGELEATVLEVKVIEGLGTTIDVILSNGVLNENDRIVVCGLEGAIATNVRALLTPQPLRELRVKSNYVHHKSIKAAMGIKISANGLDKAVAGSRLLVVTAEDDEEELKRDVMQDLETLMSGIDTTGRGVWVQASTLGSLEALLSFLRDMKIPVSGINIGPVHKKDVVKASVMLESAKEYAVMLCFDVKVEKEAMELAEDVGVTVFQADIIYHLYDKFTAYYKDLTEKKKADVAHVAVWPCMLKIIPGCVFNKRDPIIVGCDVIEGSLRVGTPICVQAAPSADNPERPFITIGKVTSIEMNHKPVQVVKKGQSGGGVAVKIECPSYETPKMVGRHFLEGDTLMSKITRESIDVLKENFKAEVAQEDWRLIIRLKKIMGVA